MRILRLGNSGDRTTFVPEEKLARTLVERELERRLGSPVETIARPIWPTPALPGLVEDWMERFEPDLVFLKVSNFWTAFESVPLRLQRRLGPVGRPLAVAGLKAAANPAVSHNAVFHALRRTMQRTVGGDTHFTADEVIERIGACIRTVSRHEATLLVVRGPKGSSNYYGSQAASQRAEERRQKVHAALREICRTHRAVYSGNDVRQVRVGHANRVGDRLHNDAAGNVEVADREVEILWEAWRRHVGGVEPGSPSGQESRGLEDGAR